MTSTDDITEEGWARLKRAPFVAGMAISLADPGGPIELAKETAASLRTVQEARERKNAERRVGRPEEIPEGLELMPDPMYRALADIVELVVDGDYEELRVMSRDRLEVEDLRRRVENDCPESLVLSPREIYRVETIAKSDDPDMPGWAYFLELWTETGPARLHIEGARGGGRALHGDAERHPALIQRIWPVNAESPPVDGLSAIRRSGGLRGKGTFSRRSRPLVALAI